MIDRELFEKIEYVARIVRQSSRPFGGVQLICCGDFFQLPPVSRRGAETCFCFESPEWARTVRAPLFVLSYQFIPAHTSSKL